MTLAIGLALERAPFGAPVRGPLNLLLTVAPASAARPDTWLTLKLTNVSRKPVVVQSTAGPYSGSELIAVDEEGRRLDMRAGSMVSAPMPGRYDFEALQPGKSKEFRFRWADCLRYRGTRRVKRGLYAEYYTQDARGENARPLVVPRVRAVSNTVPLWLTPDGGVGLAQP